MIGLVLLLLLPTPTIWFSFGHKRNVSDGVVSAIGTLFALDHKLYASDYDSDSVASENKPLTCRAGVFLTETQRYTFLLSLLYFKPTMNLSLEISF